jgi:hypothetical protein
MAAIIKTLTALINDTSRATRDISAGLPTFHHSMKSGRLRASLSRNPRSTRTDDAKSHQSSEQEKDMGEGIVTAMLVIIAFKFCMRLLANKLDTGSAWRYPPREPAPLPDSAPRANEPIDAYYERMDQAHRLPRLPPVPPAKVRTETTARRWQHDLAAREQLDALSEKEGHGG